jgi:hypothetical protein
MLCVCVDFGIHLNYGFKKSVNFQTGLSQAFILTGIFFLLKKMDALRKMQKPLLQGILLVCTCIYILNY